MEKLPAVTPTTLTIVGLALLGALLMAIARYELSVWELHVATDPAVRAFQHALATFLTTVAWFVFATTLAAMAIRVGKALKD